MQTKARAVLLVSAIAGFTGSGTALAEFDQADAVKRGEAHYLFFCAHCHGADGDGRGPYSKLLKITPVDLRALQQTGDESIAERVLKAVDGRHEVGEGQEQKMPIFSDNLEVKTVYEITEYLKTIQK